MSNNIVFEDVFLVQDKDKDGKKFDKVSRIFGQSENNGMGLILDVNTELYPLAVNDKITMLLARSLSTVSTADASSFEGTETHYDAGRGDRPSLADDYEYVMYGKVYKFDENRATNKVQSFISFGGLLLCLEGESKYLQELDMGKNFYLLLRKSS